MKKRYSPARNTARAPALALEIPDFVKARQAAAVPAVPPADEIVLFHEWEAYRAALASQGLALEYVGWPPGELCPVWRVIQGEME